MTPQTQDLNRRTFLSTTAAVSGAAMFGLSTMTSSAMAGAANDKFKMHFAPHPGMFKVLGGTDVIDQIKFAHDQGFTAWEQNPMASETPETQEKIGNTLAKLDMTMGVFVAYGSFDQPTFAVKDEAAQKEILTRMREAVEVAKRVGAKWCTVVPGSVDQQSINSGDWNKYGGGRLAEGYQTANVIDMLRRCAEILEPHDLCMVLEPLNWESNHGGVFLRYSDQAYAICRAVNSPSCKILFDIYHQQITEGNLIPNIDQCWDEIGYFQSGDNPGRKEPGTGEIHYRNVFQHIHDRSMETDREFVIGMEHGNSQRGEEGELAVIQAYRDVDAR